MTRTSFTARPPFEEGPFAGAGAPPRGALQTPAPPATSHLRREETDPVPPTPTIRGARIYVSPNCANLGVP